MLIANFQDAVCKCVYVDCVGFSDIFAIVCNKSQKSKEKKRSTTPTNAGGSAYGVYGLVVNNVMLYLTLTELTNTVAELDTRKLYVLVLYCNMNPVKVYMYK